MTSARMGARYIDEARGRVELVQLALERGLWATVVRESQECVELFLKGALRLVAIEPTRTPDVSDVLRREAGRFPAWFAAEIDGLASISTELAGDRGIAFYGDERQTIAPQELFGVDDARRAAGQLDHVAGVVTRLRDQAAAGPPSDRSCPCAGVIRSAKGGTYA